MISCLVAHPLRHLHYRTLERLKLSALKSNAGDYKVVITLDHPSLKDLHWWILTLPTACVPLDRGPCTSVFTCDASEKGWSACFNGQKVQEQFSVLEAPYSTNTKEIYAVLFGLRVHWRFYKTNTFWLCQIPQQQ